MDSSVDVSKVVECGGKPCIAINLDESALNGNEVDISDVMFTKKDEIALDSSTDQLIYEVCRVNTHTMATQNMHTSSAF